MCMVHSKYRTNFNLNILWYKMQKLHQQTKNVSYKQLRWLIMYFYLHTVIACLYLRNILYSSFISITI